MKWTLVLLLTAMLAGCTAPEAPDDEATDGPSMMVPAPGHEGADEMIVNDGSDDTSEPADGFAPQQGRYEASSDDLSLVADFFTEECGEAYCVHAVATNEGADDLWVNDICITPWSESMQQGGSDVDKSEPVAVCEAWGLGAMASQEHLEADLTWDGRLWDADAGAYRDAAEDSYTWRIHFTYYADAEGNGREEVVVDVPVIIGET